MKVVFIIEKSSDGYFSCYSDQDFDGFGLLGYGDTAEDAKKDLMSAYEEIKQDRTEEGKETPEIEFVWKYDMESFFDYFSVLNVSELARKTGINTSQLRRYRSGLTKASEKQYDKIRQYVHQVAEELAHATF